MFCHRCFAGGPDHPGSDYTENPSWLQSMDAERPWDVDSPPPLAKIPFDVTCPERALQGDLFHIFKTGIGRDIAGGVLMTLMRTGFFDYEGSTQNLTDRLTRAHSSFTLWCQAEGHCPGLRSFSKQFFNVKNYASSPWVSSKGSDTMLLLRFCCFFLQLNIVRPPGDHVRCSESFLRDMLEVCQSAVGLTAVHTHGLWMERSCAKLMYVKMLTLLRGYSVLGRRSLEAGRRAFTQKPKLHALHHLAISLRSALQSGSSLVMSPQACACEANEDYIGRVARLSRRVGFKLVDRRVSERIFIKTFALLKRRKNPKSASARPIRRVRKVRRR